MSLRTRRGRLLVAVVVVVVVAAGVVTVLRWPLRYRPLYDESMDQTTAPTVAIADPAVALTFARTRDAPARVMLVTGYGDGTVAGVDVGQALGRPAADPVELLADEGYERLAALAPTLPARCRYRSTGWGFPSISATGISPPGSTSQRTPVRWPSAMGRSCSPSWSDLPPGTPQCRWATPCSTTKPRSPGYRSRRSRARHRPRLASSWSTTTPTAPPCSGWSTPTTSPRAPGSPPPRARPATSRWATCSWCRVTPPRSSRTSCSRSTSTASFASAGRPTDLVWDLDTIIDQAYQRQPLSWDHRGQPVSLFDGTDQIPARSLILAGTPEGTIYTDIDLARRAEGFLRWLSLGWGRSISDHAIDAYIDDARSAGIYLQPGDRITITADNLGVIDNPATG